MVRDDNLEYESEDLNSKSASATDKLSDFQNVALPWTLFPHM